MMRRTERRIDDGWAVDRLLRVRDSTLKDYYNATVSFLNRLNQKESLRKDQEILRET